MLKSNSSHYQDFTNLEQWLYYLENLHSIEIDLGLARIGKVAQRLAIDLSFAKVITVAGTNGKGTTCAFIENALLNAKNHGSQDGVAVYSSPHIERFNERLRINKQDIAEQPLMHAFKKIEAVRAEISLSYYEYTTLAALLVLMDAKPRYIILEVGLGGRLDATNLIDADIAVITTIDLDDQYFLGNDRESIGFEKAGIMRQEQDIVIGDTSVPKSVLAHAHSLQAIHGERLFLREPEFVVKSEKSPSHSQLQWQWQSKQTQLTQLKTPFIPQDNVATALMVLEKIDIALSSEFVNKIIAITKVPGRTELIHQANHCDVILDVGHNPQATRYLADHLKRLKEQASYENVYAVVAMLADKDISACLLSLKDDVDYWYAGALDVPRAASKETMQKKLAMFTNATNCFDNVDQAFKMANMQASSSDLILVFGSFFTVAQIRSQLITC